MRGLGYAVAHHPASRGPGRSPLLPLRRVRLRSAALAAAKSCPPPSSTATRCRWAADHTRYARERGPWFTEPGGAPRTVTVRRPVTRGRPTHTPRVASRPADGLARGPRWPGRPPTTAGGLRRRRGASVPGRSFSTCAPPRAASRHRPSASPGPLARTPKIAPALVGTPASAMPRPARPWARTSCLTQSSVWSASPWWARPSMGAKRGRPSC